MRLAMPILAVLAGTLCTHSAQQGTAAEDAPWQRHTIDNSSRGADGVRLADVNGDGLLDMTTGWEEGGVIRVYLNPDPQRATLLWPAVTVGKVKSPEDAVFADLDGDGAIDVVSSCEGKTRTMFVHWAPAEAEDYLTESAWKTQAFPATQNEQLWMFALPLDVDGRNGVDLIVSSKGDNGSIGWLESPANPRDINAWKYHRLRDSGWIMSLVARDMDGDGDHDVVASDRKGSARGILWLMNPGPEAARLGRRWFDRTLAATNREVMFLDSFQANSDGGRLQILAAAKPAEILWFRRKPERSTPEQPAYEVELELRESIELERDGIGTAKSVRAADLDLDGNMDLVFSCEQADGNREGVFWLRGNGEVGLAASDWQRHPISGSEGVKFDLLQLLDLDADGDLDVITCEERTNLGVIWYENPAKQPASSR